LIKHTDKIQAVVCRAPGLFLCDQCNMDDDRQMPMPCVYLKITVIILK